MKYNITTETKIKQAKNNFAFDNKNIKLDEEDYGTIQTTKIKF